MSDTKSTPNGSPEQPELNVSKAPDYRDGYANSVQVRMKIGRAHV